MPDAKQRIVLAGKASSFSNVALSPVVGIGTLQTNIDIATGAATRSGVATSEVFSDGPSAGVAGVEVGATSATLHFSSLPSGAGRIAPGAAFIGGVNDTINVGQHVLQGNGAEALSGVGLACRVLKSAGSTAARCLSRKKLFSQLSPSGLGTVLMLLLPLATAPAIAQSPASDTPATAASGVAAAPPKMSRYVATHEGSRSVFRRDPNIWVMTPEVAERSGMPKEWASTELKGVAAAAFRREPEGAEQDCGFGGNKNACRPVINCVLDLYFDRNTHLLPWREAAPVADFNTYQGTSWTHIFFGGVPDPISGATGRRNQLFLLEPFADPISGGRLFWWWTSPVYMTGTGKSRVMAYDREIHGSFSYVKLEVGCTGKDVNGESLVLQLRDARSNVVKQFHEIYLPASWTKRVDALSKSTRQQDESFYKGVFESINAKDGERK